MVNKVEEVKLMACREGSYTVYVFQVIGSRECIMCTRLPNWKIPSINIGDEGYLEYQKVRAGESYFNVEQQQEVVYQYSNIYFINFIQKTEILKNNEIIL